MDIGTGNGEIAALLARYFDVTSVDINVQKTLQHNFSFFEVSDERLPFPDASFDVIVSNHVIEHVRSADLHLSEMARVLASNGIIYLATPNRLWPWEVHYHIALLHYLPQRFFMSLLKKIGKYREELWLLSWPALKRKAQKHFSVCVVSDAVCKWPRHYYLNISKLVENLLSRIPLRLFRLFTFIHPTLIVVLRHKN